MSPSTIEYNSYDEMGREKSVSKTIDGTTWTSDYDYDYSGKITGITYPDDFCLNYTYYQGSNLFNEVLADSGGPICL